MSGADPKPISIVAVYARVSTARQEEKGTIETPLAVVRDFAAQKGFSIVQRYVDEGWSGDILARPALDQLRADARARIWDARPDLRPGPFSATLLLSGTGYG
jgi:site-specific DNA recombinase